MSAMEDETIAGLQQVNAALTRERDAALAREAALAEVLDVINRSPADPGPVFDAILEKAHTLCGAAVGSLVTYDGKYFRAVATHGLPEQLAETVRRPFPPTALQQALVRGERLNTIPDAGAIQPERLDDAGRQYPDLTGVRTFLQVPLRKDGTLLGFIGAHRLEVRPFSEQEIALLESFAAQAVIAMENARLLGELRDQTSALSKRNSEFSERIEHQSATIDVLKEMSGSPGDSQPVFELIVRRAKELCDSAGAALLEFDGELVHFRAAYGNDPGPARDYEASFPMRPARGSLACRAILEKQIVHIRDVQADAELLPVVRKLGLKSNIAMPLMRDGAVIGVFTLFAYETGGFTDSQVELLKTFAEQAVIAIGSAETYRALQTRTADLQETLEYQTATSDVLKVISRSTFDLQPMLDTVVETAARLCDADQAMIGRREGDLWRVGANFGFPPEFEAYRRARDAYPLDQDSPSVSARAVLERRTVHIHDAAAVPGYPQISITLGKQRTSLGVPLLREGEAIGYIVLARQRVDPFTDRQINLVTTFAAQAVIAMENARLITEQQEALEQQTATAEVLQVINASPGELAPVFDAMLEKAMRLCGAAFGSLFTYDGGRFQSAAQRGVPAAYAEFREKNSPRARGGSPMVRLVETSRTIHVLDVMTETFYQDGDPNSRAIVDLGGARTALIVPLLKDNVLLGCIVIYRQEVRAFSDKQIALLENFAAHAVIAMENARLINEQQEALEQQTATAEVLQVINASPGNLAPVFDTILEKAMRLCGSAFGTIHTYDGECFQFVGMRGVEPAAAHIFREPIGPTPGMTLYRIAHGEDVVQVADITDDDVYRSGNPTRRRLADVCGARTQLLIALRKDDALLGVLNFFRQEVRPFTDKQVALLENFAAQAVIAMENARLLHELRTSTDELARRQAELRITFENMGDGVAMFDETPRLVAWNHKFQEIFAVPIALLEEHRSYADYIRYLAARGDFGPGVDPEEQLRRFAETAGEYHAYERTRPDGRVIEIRHNPVAGGGFVLIFSDITERKRHEVEIAAARDAAQEATRTIEAAFRDLKTAQANLIQAEKMASLGQLTAGIAHEIKNPLNFVNNFAILSVELLKELKETAAPGFAALTGDQRADIEEVSGMLTSNLEKITEHGKRADGIVRSMLEHSRGASGERREVDINALADEALNLAYHGARAQDQSFNITLERAYAEGIAPIEVNPQDLTRVFLNLFSNGFYAANKRAKSGGQPGYEPTLTVTTSEIGGAVEIRVRDNGTGIPAEIRDKLFQPFFTTKPAGEGTGLGLSITYDIVTKQHGGTIAVESEVVGRTEFVVTLPRRMFASDGDTP